MNAPYHHVSTEVNPHGRILRVRTPHTELIRATKMALTSPPLTHSLSQRFGEIFEAREAPLRYSCRTVIILISGLWVCAIFWTYYSSR